MISWMHRKWTEARQRRAKWYADERRKIEAGAPACANCRRVTVAEPGLYCFGCADGLH